MKKKKISFHCAEWFYKGWTSQGAVAAPEEVFAEGRAHTSIQRAPLCIREPGLGWERGSGSPGTPRASTEWTILFGAHRWQFSLPPDQCWPLNTNKLKPLQQIYSTQRVQRESSFSLARQGSFHATILELDLIFMTVLEGGNLTPAAQERPFERCCISCAWRLRGNDAVCLWRLCHSHPTDGFLESTWICSASQPRICYCGCFVATLIKSLDEYFCLWRYLVGRKKSNWDAEDCHACFSEFQTHCWQLYQESCAKFYAINWTGCCKLQGNTPGPERWWHL